MEKIKLISDSTCDLSKELIEELDLEIVPLVVSFEDDDTTYKDGIDITSNDIIDHVNKTGKLPTTGAVGPGIFEEVFNKYIDEGYACIYTGIGSNLSSTFQSATIGRNTCKNPDLITIIDSNNLSSAIGLVLLKIRDFINDGLNREEIKNKVEKDIVPNLHASFCIDTADYLVKGGRCSSLAGFLIKAMRIKPIIVVQDGKLVVGKKPIGNLNIALKTQYLDMMKEYDNIDKKYLFVTSCHSFDADKYADTLINEKCEFEHVYHTEAGSVISSHCGPGTIGILYIKEPTTKKSKGKK